MESLSRGPGDGRRKVLAIGRDLGASGVLRGLSDRARIELVWGDRIRERDEVKLYVSYLRRKLGGAADVDPVETVRGVGYRYRPRLVKSTNGSGADSRAGRS